MQINQTNRLNKRWLWVFIAAFPTIIFLFYITLFSNVLLRYFFYEKIWVHRVNSIEKLKEVEADFYGVELDVVFLDSLNIFDVTHPPVPSINLNLSEYLKSREVDEVNFWIDFKNLDRNNIQNSLIRLNGICSQFDIDKSRFIIESSNPDYLDKFKTNGFNTSYYLPWPGLYNLNPDDLTGKLNEIQNNIDNNNLIQISSNYHDYKIMKKEFPDKNKLLWLTGLEKEYPNSIKERLFLYEILMDNKVKVLLVEYKSKAKNR